MHNMTKSQLTHFKINCKTYTFTAKPIETSSIEEFMRGVLKQFELQIQAKQLVIEVK